MEFLSGLFISVYFSVFKFVDCVVVCWSSFLVCLFSVYFSVFKFVDCVVVCWSSFVVFLFLFISLCLSLWTVWWFVGVPLWYFYFCLFLCV